MLAQLRSVRSKFRELSRRQDHCDTVTAVVENDQGHIKESVQRIERTLERHIEEERRFFTDVRSYMRNGAGEKKEKK